MSQTAYKSTKMDAILKKSRFHLFVIGKTWIIISMSFFFIYPLHGFPHGESCR